MSPQVVFLILLVAVLGNKDIQVDASGSSFGWFLLGLFFILIVVFICVGVIVSLQMTTKVQINGVKTMYKRDVESGIIDDPTFSRMLSDLRMEDMQVLREHIERGKIN